MKVTVEMIDALNVISFKRFIDLMIFCHKQFKENRRWRILANILFGKCFHSVSGGLIVDSYKHLRLDSRRNSKSI